MYEDIYSTIDDLIRWGTLDETGRSKHDDTIDGNSMLAFCFAYDDEREALRAAAARSSILKLRVTLEEATDADIIGRKLLVYADLPVLQIGEDPSVTVAGGDWNTSEYDEHWQPHDPDPSFVPLQFIRALVALRPLVESGSILVLPRDDFSYLSGRDEPFLASFDGHDAELRMQLIEQLPGIGYKPSVEIKLPHLRGIPAHELAAFRKAHGFEFERFHRRIAQLLDALSSSAKPVSDESRILRVIEEVDYEIRRIDDVVKNARRKSLALSGYDLAYIIGGLVLYGVLPHDLAQTLLGALGGATIKSITDRLSAPSMDRTDPFYIAWKLHRKFGNQQSPDKEGSLTPSLQRTRFARR